MKIMLQKVLAGLTVEQRQNCDLTRKVRGVLTRYRNKTDGTKIADAAWKNMRRVVDGQLV